MQSTNIYHLAFCTKSWLIPTLPYTGTVPTMASRGILKKNGEGLIGGRWDRKRTEDPGLLSEPEGTHPEVKDVRETSLWEGLASTRQEVGERPTAFTAKAS